MLWLENPWMCEPETAAAGFFSSVPKGRNLKISQMAKISENGNLVPKYLTKAMVQCGQNRDFAPACITAGAAKGKKSSAIWRYHSHHNCNTTPSLIFTSTGILIHTNTPITLFIFYIQNYYLIGTQKLIKNLLFCAIKLASKT